VVTQDSSQRRLGTAAAKTIKKKEKIRQHGAKSVFLFICFHLKYRSYSQENSVMAILKK
jgi:hypothetical protein